MSEFLAALLSIPTVFFTGFLGLVLLYWLRKLYFLHYSQPMQMLHLVLMMNHSKQWK